ncbi:MAG: tRNA preQ1(34) S-adenosylmethionine ribosyltransferase-isomerase QueA [Opitutaceae bacterium]|nr:tRNA preQ1(34) S-adenosylmethionine ribosyltransferase-isomerase QueA [Opitutaceae bacterium]
MPPLATELFDYELPPHLVAQTPAPQRDASRLLVVDRATHRIAHHTFAELPQFLRGGDILFRNNASVLPARLLAKRPTGGQVECFLLRPADGQEIWRCLIKPGKKLPPGATFAHESGAFSGEIVAKEPDGSALVRLRTPGNESIIAVANRLGEVPLPPYITRDDRSQHRQDLERYQTVYADRTRQVAVAAPTAGLHFTPDLFTTLSDQGVKTADITLHVGLGTFKPITTDTIEAHAIHRELYEMSVSTQQALFPPLTGRRVAVGTTTVRSVEDFLALHHAPLSHPHLAEAGLFIYPPRSFRGVDALITNFHQPRSTLLCLVAAFLSPGAADGIEWLKAIYAEAIAQEYRFFSYGDAMLIL